MRMSDFAARLPRFGVAALALAALAACTTAEGTNAFTDVGTFEREVMSSTLQGLSVIPKEAPKDQNLTPRAPLAMPRDNGQLPPPQQAAAVAQLPADSDGVEVDVSGLTAEDVAKLRNARVVDLRSVSGRPLTAEEVQKLTAGMKAARIAYGQSTERALYLPPDEYFTTSPDGQQMVCLAANGDVVPLVDPRCPAEIRAALSQ